MTVKCLDQDQKNFIAAGYREGVFDSDELAIMHGVSRRTIQRVLLECGVARSRVFYGRRPKPVEPVKQVERVNQVNNLPITMHEPREVFVPKLPPFPKPTQPEEPFLKRLWVFVKHALSIPFK
jgi:hypothetical protein